MFILNRQCTMYTKDSNSILYNWWHLAELHWFCSDIIYPNLILVTKQISLLTGGGWFHVSHQLNLGALIQCLVRSGWPPSHMGCSPIYRHYQLPQIKILMINNIYYLKFDFLYSHEDNICLLIMAKNSHPYLHLTLIKSGCPQSPSPFMEIIHHVNTPC